MAAKDFTGLRGGKLTATKRTNRQTTNRSWIWEFKCDCGGTTEARVADVKRGHTTSCGCNQKQATKEAKLEHGMEGERLYRVWANMKTRCTNPNNRAYKWYGGRGINVYDDWLEFIPFMEWALNNGYKEHLTIERIDNNEGYNPTNCEWIPLEKQALNRTNTKVIDINGKSYTVKEVSEITGTSIYILWNRRNRSQEFLTPIELTKFNKEVSDLTKKEYDKVVSGYEKFKETKGD